MRKTTLKVPPQAMAEFAERLLDTGFENEIVGVSRHDEIEVEVRYEKDEADLLEILEEYLEELINDLEDEEEDQEDD